VLKLSGFEENMKTIKFILLIFPIFLNCCDLIKKNTVTQNDKQKYSKSYQKFHYRIVNEVSRSGDETFFNPKFKNIRIPDKLERRFTIDALNNDFQSYDFDSIKNIFIKTKKSASWYIKEKDHNQKGYQIYVNLHNYHYTKCIHHIILSVKNEDSFLFNSELFEKDTRNYTLYNYTNRINLFGEDAIQLTNPSTDALFSCEINCSTYDKIKEENFTTRINQIFYWFEL